MYASPPTLPQPPNHNFFYPPPYYPLTADNNNPFRVGNPLFTPPPNFYCTENLYSQNLNYSLSTPRFYSSAPPFLFETLTNDNLLNSEILPKKDKDHDFDTVWSELQMERSEAYARLLQEELTKEDERARQETLLRDEQYARKLLEEELSQIRGKEFRPAVPTGGKEFPPTVPAGGKEFPPTVPAGGKVPDSPEKHSGTPGVDLSPVLGAAFQALQIDPDMSREIEQLQEDEKIALALDQEEKRNIPEKLVFPKNSIIPEKRYVPKNNKVPKIPAEQLTNDQMKHLRIIHQEYCETCSKKKKRKLQWRQRDHALAVHNKACHCRMMVQVQGHVHDGLCCTKQHVHTGSCRCRVKNI